MSKSQNALTDETLIGIDYGEKNIGIAFGRNGLATPLTVLSGKSDNIAVAEISKLAIENKASKIVIGLPLSHDGKETYQSKKVRLFSKLLKIYLKKPVVMVNEVATTVEAIEERLKADTSKKSRSSVDHFSAALILKRFFEDNGVS